MGNGFTAGLVRKPRDETKVRRALCEATRERYYTATAVFSIHQLHGPGRAAEAPKVRGGAAPFRVGKFDRSDRRSARGAVNGASAGLAAAALLIALLCPIRSQAEQREGPGAAATIVVTFDPRSVEQGRAAAAVQAHVSGLPVRVLVEPIERAQNLEQRLATSGALARDRGALGTFSIEIASRRDLLIFFTERDGNATLIRRLPRGSGGVRLAIEEAAIIIRSLVEALLEGRRIGMSDRGVEPEHGPVVKPKVAEAASGAAPTAAEPRSEAADIGALRGRAPEAEARPSPLLTPGSTRDRLGGGDAPGDGGDGEGTVSGGAGPALRRRALSVGAGYSGAAFASASAPTSAPRWSSGVILGLRWRIWPSVSAVIRYTFLPRLEGSDDAAQIAISRHPVELAAAYAGATRVAPTADLGLVGDYGTRVTLRTGADYRPTPSDGRFMVALAVRAGATWSLSALIHLNVRAGVDLLLSRFEYVLPDGRAAVVPRTVRPRLDLDVDVAVW